MFCPEFHGGQRQLAVDLLQTGLLPGIEQRPGTHEFPVGLLQQAALFGIEVQRGPLVIDGLHPFEKPLVQPYLVGVRRQQGHHLLLQGLHLGGVLGLAQHAEYQRRLGEHLPRIVVSEDDVFERGIVIVRRDGIDLGIVQRHAALQRGQEMCGSYPVERRNPVRSVPFGEKGFSLPFLSDLQDANAMARKSVNKAVIRFICRVICVPLGRNNGPFIYRKVLPYRTRFFIPCISSTKQVQS